MQQKDDDPGNPARRDNLDEPRADGTEHGNQDVWGRQTSVLLEAQLNPLLVPIAAAAAGLELLAELPRLGRRPERRRAS
jgi:hypothetical protein